MLRAERGWLRSHSQASWINVVRSRGLPALDTPCSRSTAPLCQGVGARPAYAAISHDEGLVKGSHHGYIERSPVASVSKVDAPLRDAARFRARSTSHSVDA